MENKINPYELSLSELIFYFRQLELVDFKRFQRELYEGTLELYWQASDVVNTPSEEV